MTTNFKTYIGRENIGNSILKNNISKTAPGQRGVSTKTFHAPTPRRALGDLGNIQHSTGKKLQTPKPSKVKIFEETPKTKTSVKSKKGTFSVLSHKLHNKTTSDAKMKTKRENKLPEIENMTPFIDQEKDIPRSHHITKLLNHHWLLNPSQLAPPTYQDEIQIPSSQYKYDSFVVPDFDETVANIIGYDEKPELVEVDPFALDCLPPLDDVDAPLMS